jgi:hypothetical protein
MNTDPSQELGAPPQLTSFSLTLTAFGNSTVAPRDALSGTALCAASDCACRFGVLSLIIVSG